MLLFITATCCRYLFSLSHKLHQHNKKYSSITLLLFYSVIFAVYTFLLVWLYIRIYIELRQ